MEIRNATWSTQPGLIDCEHNHPSEGWIPCTLGPDDGGGAADAYAAALQELGEQPSAIVAPAIVAQIRLEVSRRILAEASAATRENMMAAKLAGLLDDPADNAAFIESVEWVNAVRAKGVELAAAADPTYADDSHWPEPTAGARALAARF